LNLQTTIEPLRVHGLKSLAARPQYCALSNEKVRSAGIDMPGWQSTISSHIRQMRPYRSRIQLPVLSCEWVLIGSFLRKVLRSATQLTLAME